MPILSHGRIETNRPHDIVEASFDTSETSVELMAVLAKFAWMVFDRRGAIHHIVFRDDLNDAVLFKVGWL